MGVMKYVGVDGCKGGWLAVSLDGDAAWCGMFTTFGELWADHKDAQCLFVDIPIGLPASGDRQADVMARQALPSSFKSTIFNTPVRKAVYAKTKDEARAVNRELSGKSLSEQSLGIIGKIIEVDMFLQEAPAAVARVFESHPEICFSRLAEGALQYRKKDVLGALERLRLIRKFVPEVEKMMMDVRARYSRAKVEGDDMLDAFVLALSARGCSGTPQFFPSGLDMPPRDETGLPMAIWYHDFTNTV